MIRFNERIRIGGEMIPTDLRLLDDVERADQQQAAAPTARHFLQRRRPWPSVVPGTSPWRMETGMGVPRQHQPDCAVGCGDDRNRPGTCQFSAARASRVGKSGGYQAGRPVVVGPARGAASSGPGTGGGQSVLCAEERVAVRRLSRISWPADLHQTADGPWPPLRLPLLGDFQLDNCALAVTALEWMRAELRLPLTPEAIRAGLEKTRWPARCQVVLRDPVFLVDVAHNPDAARALAGFLKTFRGNRPVALICGMLSDKDAEGFFRLLRPVVDACVLVPLDSERNMPLERLLAAARAARLPAAEGLISTAVPNARTWAQKNNGIIVAAGSLYLAAAVLYDLELKSRAAYGARGCSGMSVPPGSLLAIRYSPADMAPARPRPVIPGICRGEFRLVFFRGLRNIRLLIRRSGAGEPRHWPTGGRAT